MTALEKLRDLEAAIAAAQARQQELRTQKERAIQAVTERRRALVTALETDLDGKEPATAKARTEHEKAQRAADGAWDERIEAAGRLIDQARTKRSVYVANHIDALMAEMSGPAAEWPDRARRALDALYTVAREYDQLGGPIERLAQEAGLTALRVPGNPLERFASELNRMREMPLHAPIPAAPGAVTFDKPPEGLEELATTRPAARFV